MTALSYRFRLSAGVVGILLAASMACASFAAHAEVGPVADFSVAAPLDGDGPIISEAPSVVADHAAAEPYNTPETRLVGIAALIASVLLAIRQFLSSPVMGGVWSKLPPFAQVAVLAGLASLGALANALATGASWPAAISAAFVALFAVSTPSLVSEAKRI